MAAIDSPIPCQYCGGSPMMVYTHDGQRAVECERCGARGPCIEPHRTDCDSQAVAAWNAGKKFGRLAVASVPGGMPAATCSVAERLRLVSESLYTGELGSPQSAIVIFQDGKRVHTITHRISDADAARVLAAVHDAASARALVIPPPSQH